MRPVDAANRTGLECPTRSCTSLLVCRLGLFARTPRDKRQQGDAEQAVVRRFSWAGHGHLQVPRNGWSAALHFAAMLRPPVAWRQPSVVLTCACSPRAPELQDECTGRDQRPQGQGLRERGERRWQGQPNWLRGHRQVRAVSGTSILGLLHAFELHQVNTQSPGEPLRKWPVRRHGRVEHDVPVGRHQTTQVTCQRAGTCELPDAALQFQRRDPYARGRCHPVRHRQLACQVRGHRACTAHSQRAQLHMGLRLVTRHCRQLQPRQQVCPEGTDLRRRGFSRRSRAPDHRRSNRSRFITLVQAATKSRTNFGPLSLCA
jgi:hypothetical protein